MRILPYIRLEGRTRLHRSYPRGSMSEFASRLAGRFDMVYVADEDGILRNRPRLDVAREICDELPTLYEGGVRNAQGVIDLLVAGAEKAVVGTATLADLDELRTAFKLSENITFKADFRDGIVSFDGHIAGRALLDLTRDVREIGVTDIVVPLSLVEEALAAKRALGITLGVMAPVAERARLDAKGADYIVAEDYGSLVDDG